MFTEFDGVCEDAEQDLLEKVRFNHGALLLNLLNLFGLSTDPVVDEKNQLLLLDALSEAFREVFHDIDRALDYDKGRLEAALLYQI